jgi:hypothetical protein
MMADDRSKLPPYINDPTRLLVEMLARMIEDRPDWRDSYPLRAAFGEFDLVCRREPAIVGFIRRTAADPNGALTLDQIKLVMLATFMRSSSSYGTIPELVVMMNLASDYDFATKINDNAVHEAGTSKLTSHPKLLLQSFGVLSKAIREHFRSHGQEIDFTPLTQASHAILRQLFAFQASSNGTLASFAEFQRFLGDAQIYIPPFTEDDYFTACNYSALCDKRIARYHSAILAQILGMKDRFSLEEADHFRRDPTDRRWLAQQAFEFCTREASSADVGTSISYVGAYGLFAQALLGYVPKTERDVATRWWWVHSDEDVGEALGWGTTAEQGHARDAIELVDRLFEGLSAENATFAVRTATLMSHLRLKHWKAVTSRLVELGKLPDAVWVPFNPISYRPTAIECAL